MPDKIIAIDGTTGRKKFIDSDTLGGGPGGVDNFLDLTDTPDSFTSQALKLVRVNTGADALEFITQATLKLDDFGAPDDNTDLNATTGAHGLLRKLSNVASEFLDGQGNWDTVKDSDLSTSDITTNDVSTSKHGFVPKAPNSGLVFLDGLGAWNEPPYTLQVSAANQATTTDAQTIYFGCHAGLAPQTTAAISKVYIPRAGTITRAYIMMHSGTAGTNESFTAYIRLNNTTDTSIASVAANTALREFTNTSLSIAVAAGDYIEIKVICPTWATNPANVRWGGVIYIS